MTKEQLQKKKSIYFLLSLQAENNGDLEIAEKFKYAEKQANYDLTNFDTTL